MSRKRIVAGNWKMNTTIKEAQSLVHSLTELDRNKDVTVIIALPFTHIIPVQKILKAKDKIIISAQNCHHKSTGAYTGEISPTMLKDLKVPYVILGHSERREFNFETNELLAQKLRAALDAELKIIFCCGEPLGIRKANTHLGFVDNQLKESLFNTVSGLEMKNVIIAYEPIWAIGTGETASPDQAQEMHLSIRKSLNRVYGKRIADNTSILYGGSVKGSNANETFSKPDVDGGLVGGASLNAVEFGQIINAF
jgi:triosephosphate isomerase (TIM)